MLRILRNFLFDVKESPWTFVQLVGYMMIFVAFFVCMNQAGKAVRTAFDDLHTIAESVRGSDYDD